MNSWDDPGFRKAIEATDCKNILMTGLPSSFFIGTTTAAKKGTGSIIPTLLKNCREVVSYAHKKIGAFMIRGLIIAGIFGAGLCAGSPAEDKDGTAELVADVESIQPGTPFRAGVLIRMPEHWHTYWLNSGDSGMPPKMDWQWPAGFTAGPILWPAPKTFDESPVVSFGYDHEVLLAREIRPPENIKADTNYDIGVNISWLVCRKVCVPRTSRLRLTLPARAEPPVKSAKWESVFDRAKRAIPIRDSQWRFRASTDKATLSLRVIPPPGVEAGNLAKAEFFPAQPNLVEYGPQVWTQSPREYCLRMKRISGDEPLPARLEGVLVVSQEKGKKSLDVNIAFEK